MNMKNSLISIVLFGLVLLSSCTKVVTIASPDDKVCLTFESDILDPNPGRPVRIYYGDPSNGQYAAVRYSSIVGVTVYWKTSPLIIRSVSTVYENTMDSSLVDFMTYSDDTVNDLKYKYFITYGFAEAFQGEYKPCK